MSSQLIVQEQAVSPHAVRLAPVASRYVQQKQLLTVASLHLEEETLIVDDRANVRPAQMVENKLSRVLQGSVVGVSQLRLKNLLAQRGKT